MMDFMTRPMVNPAHILDSYRKSDAVLIVCQNNALRTIEIAAINDEAARVTGFSNAELVGRSFETILPERITSTLTEFIEFDDDAHDLQAVLLKIRSFSIKGHSGKEVPYRLRVIRGEEIDKNPWFHIVLVDETQQQEVNQHRETLRENFKSNEKLNEQTDLPNRYSILKNIELVIGAVQKEQVKASFAVIDMNGYEALRSDYGQDVCNEIHRHIGQICRQKLRPEDVIASLSERCVGLLLVDAPQEEARMVLNRLRWMIGVSPIQVSGKDVTTQVNIGFAEIDGKITAGEVLEKCEGHALSLRNKMSNTIQLAVTHERREKEERRKQNVPVAIDRRRKDRRN